MCLPHSRNLLSRFIQTINWQGGKECSQSKIQLFVIAWEPFCVSSLPLHFLYGEKFIFQEERYIPAVCEPGTVHKNCAPQRQQKFPSILKSQNHLHFSSVREVYVQSIWSTSGPLILDSLLEYKGGKRMISCQQIYVSAHC